MSDAVVERLEQRTLLSASIKGGVLVIHGTAGADEFNVSLVEGSKKKGKLSERIEVIEADLRTGESRIKRFSRPAVRQIKLLGRGGADRINLDISDVPILAKGGPGNDTIIGGNGDDRLYGGGGDDSISGGSGNDLLVGNKGDDTLLGEQDNDTLVGNGGEDLFNGGAGADFLRARDRGADESIIGGSGRDVAQIDRLLDVDPDDDLSTVFADVEILR